MGITDGDAVTIEYTGRLDDGTVFDTSIEAVAAETGLDAQQPDRDYSPLTFEMGASEVIPGLEEGLRDLEAGDEETVTIPPAEAYGEVSDERVIEYEREEFESMLQGVEAEPGMHVQTADGAPGEVQTVGEEHVEVDFNHELAGETLEFEVEIVDVQ